ncbi:ABC transporter substrate-binding protein [bacterium]|nr:ABC transporter substrate-binding protein [bacterium]
MLKSLCPFGKSRHLFCILIAATLFLPTAAENIISNQADLKRIQTTGKPGGKLISCFLNDPTTFHPLITDDLESQIRNQLMNPGLVRINLGDQTLQPELAESWEISQDQLQWTFKLRKELRWSDGAPFNAADVLFTLEVVNHPNFPNAARDALTTNQKTVSWRMVDDHTVVAELPSVFASFLRKLDSTTLPIIPKHKWEKAFRAGTLSEDLSVNVRPVDYVTLGPFMLKQYKTGQYVQLMRNPHYWKRDSNNQPLPYLEEIVFLVLSDLNLVHLKMQTGEIDTFYSIRPQDVALMKEKASLIGMKLYNLGSSYGYEGLFFNQNGGRNPKTGMPYLDHIKRSWFTDLNFRKAVAYSIDREAMVKNVLFGMGQPSFGPESPSNVLWYNNGIVKYPYNLDAAMRLLANSGFFKKIDKDGKAVLYDSRSNPVRFSLFTNAGNTVRNQQCLNIVSDLAKLGITVHYSAVEFRSLVSKIISSYDYDSILLGKSHEIDPADSMATWTSSSSGHFWWPNQQTPATSWEKRIDELMRLQNETFDQRERKKYYDEVQYLLSDQLPMIFTVNETIWVCAKEKIGNLKPSVSRHRTLWNAEELYWRN